MPAKIARFAQLQTKVEAVEETLETLAGTDAVQVEDLRIDWGLDLEQTNEHTSSLDSQADIVGGMACSIGFRLYLKGSDTPGELPDWDDILRACGLARTVTKQTIAGTGIALANATRITDSGSGLAALTVGTVFHLVTAAGQRGSGLVTASAAGQIDFVRLPVDSGAAFVAESAGGTFTIRYGVAGTAATAGTTTTATLQAPFAATAQLYRGMPVWLSGNPASPELALIADYTAARVAALHKIYGSALSSSTRASIPPHVLYQPTSALAPTLSVAVHFDGVRHRFVGARGNIDLAAETGRSWKAQVRLQGLFLDRADAAAPTPTYDGTRPGPWRQSHFSIGRTECGLSRLALGFGNTLDWPMNPNKQEGRDAPQIVARRHTLAADPYLSAAATRDLLADMRAGQHRIVAAWNRGGPAAQPGNALALMCPDVQIVGMSPLGGQAFLREEFAAFPGPPDAGFHLSIF